MSLQEVTPDSDTSAAGGLMQEALKQNRKTIRKVQAGRPPGNKDIVYDEAGNIISVLKISAEQLPQHRIKVGYRVVDPAVEAANARLEAMKKGRRFADDKNKD